MTTLISTLKAGIQEVFKAWSARWSLEVSHRLRKQSLALGACQCLTYAAHLQHAELVTEAFNLICQERQRTPGSSWKQSQQRAAEILRNALLTGSSRLAARNYSFSTGFHTLATLLRSCTYAEVAAKGLGDGLQ